MKTTVLENRNILLEEIYNPITLRTNNNEEISICMRDSGFEFVYEGKHYSAQKGIIEELNYESKSVSIDFDKMENITLSEEGDRVRIKIKALGETSIPTNNFFNGVNELKNKIEKK